MYILTIQSRNVFYLKCLVCFVFNMYIYIPMYIYIYKIHFRFLAVHKVFFCHLCLAVALFWGQTQGFVNICFFFIFAQIMFTFSSTEGRPGVLVLSRLGLFLYLSHSSKIF